MRLSKWRQGSAERLTSPGTEGREVVVRIAYPTGKGGKDARKAIQRLVKEYGWEYSNDVGKSAHHIGWLTCSDVCIVKVFSTSRNPAQAIWKEARKCPHGHRPKEIKP